MESGVILVVGWDVVLDVESALGSGVALEWRLVEGLGVESALGLDVALEWGSVVGLDVESALESGVPLECGSVVGLDVGLALGLVVGFGVSWQGVASGMLRPGKFSTQLRIDLNVRQRTM